MSTYSIIKMHPLLQGKWFCAKKTEPYGILCYNRATHYLVEEREGKRARRFRRCTECARKDAIKMKLSMPQEPTA